MRKSGYKWKDSIGLAVSTGIGTIIARMLISDTPLGLALIVALIVGFFVYLFLQLHRICLSISLIHASNLVNDVSVKQNAFSQTCLSCVHVRDDPYIDNFHSIKSSFP